MYDVRDIANYILEAFERRDVNITNLALHKLLYFAHGWFFATYDRPLIKNKFEAWQYGPVQRVIYDQLKGYRDQPLRGARVSYIDPESGLQRVRAPVIEKADSDLVDVILSRYERYSAAQLVNESHVEDGPWEYVWQQAEDAIYPGMRIPDELILLHFKRLPSFMSIH